MSEATRPKPRRLRFSLNTLTVGVLLLGSAALLWWNGAPFAPATSIKSGPIRAAALSPDGSLIAIYKLNDAVCIHNAKTGAQLKTFDASRNAGWPSFGMSFSPASKFVFLWSGGTSFSYDKVWHIESGREMPIDLSEFSPSENYALTNYRTKWVTLPGCKEVGIIPNDIVDSAFSSDDQWLAALFINNDDVRIYEAKTGALQKNLRLLHPQNIAASPTQNLLAVTVSPNEVELKTLLVDLPNGNPIATFPGKIGAHPFSTNGKFLLTIDDDCCVWDVNTHNLVSRIKADKLSVLSLSGDRLLCRATLSAWDTQTGQQLWELSEINCFFRRDGETFHGPSFPNEIVSARTGKSLWRMDQLRWPGESILDVATLGNDNRMTLLTVRKMPDAAWVSLWHQTRPFNWYGLAWLPEFWIVLLLAGAFAWSLRRDRI